MKLLPLSFRGYAAFCLGMGLSLLLGGPKNLLAQTPGAPALRLDFSEAVYAPGASLAGLGEWKFFPQTGNSAQCRVQEEEGNRFAGCATNGVATYGHPLAPRNGIAELSWRWRATDTASRLAFGVAGAPSQAGSWSDFKLRLRMDGGGRWAVSSPKEPSDNSRWPLRQTGRWYYMRLRMDLQKGSFSFFLDTLSTRRTEIALVAGAAMDTGAVSYLLVKSDNGNAAAQVHFDEIEWKTVPVKVWDGGGANGNWSTAQNWSEDLVPGPEDEVLFDKTSVKTCLLDIPVQIASLSMRPGYTGTLDLGGSVLSVSQNADFGSGGAFAAAGGAIRFNGRTLQKLHPSATATLPPLEHGGPGTLVLGGALQAQSLVQAEGSFDFNGYGFSLVKDLTVSDGAPGTFLNLGGKTLTVGGNALLAGRAAGGGGAGSAPGTAALLGLSPGAEWILDVKGSLQAALAVIGQGKALSSKGVAINSQDAGGNTGWLFSQEGPPLFASQPASQTIRVGEKATFRAGAVGSAPLSYQWYKNGTAITGANEASYTTPAAPKTDNGARFKVTVKNGLGEVTSAEAVLTVSDLPVIGRHPAAVRRVAGFKFSFSIEAESSSPMTYQWYKNGAPLPGATSRIFEDTARFSDDNAQFEVRLKNAAGEIASNKAALDVLACGEEFSASADTAVSEGVSLDLVGISECATRQSWTGLTPGAPEIVDAANKTLRILVPRISEPVSFTYRFSAQYPSGEIKVKSVVVSVKNTIPDPVFTLPAWPLWRSSRPEDTLLLKPDISNLAEIRASAAPEIRFSWTLTGITLDTLHRKEALLVKNPRGSGTVQVKLCLQNGGPVSCKEAALMVEMATTHLVSRGAEAGSLRYESGRIVFGIPGHLRIWNMKGRLLVDKKGRAGENYLLDPARRRELEAGLLLLRLSPLSP